MFDAYEYAGYEIDITIFDNHCISNNCLVVRFPELACNSCTDSILSFISQILSEQDLENVILLIDDSHKQYLYQMERLNNFVYPNIIETSNNKIVLPIDESGLPYLFLINEAGKCSMIFIPEKDKPEETKTYISIIKNKVFNDLGKSVNEIYINH